jgi:hypothetical protein
VSSGGDIGAQHLRPSPDGNALLGAIEVCATARLPAEHFDIDGLVGVDLQDAAGGMGMGSGERDAGGAVVGGRFIADRGTAGVVWRSAPEIPRPAGSAFAINLLLAIPLQLRIEELGRDPEVRLFDSLEGFRQIE